MVNLSWLKKMVGCKEGELIAENQKLQASNLVLKNQLDQYTPSKLEEYYNNKYPKEDIAYTRWDDRKQIKIDVRQFLNHRNFNLPVISGENHDEIALNSLIWVYQKIKYTTDKKQYKFDEYWAYGYETLNRKLGDCEDGMILLYEILRYNNIPVWKIRCQAGTVRHPETTKMVGHAYLTYYSEVHDKWLVLDWCWYPNFNSFADRVDYKEEPTYKGVWFSFNELYSWGSTADIRKAKSLLTNK